jgi:hypothetical protein
VRTLTELLSDLVAADRKVVTMENDGTDRYYPSKEFQEYEDLVSRRDDLYAEILQRFDPPPPTDDPRIIKWDVEHQNLPRS